MRAHGDTWTHTSTHVELDVWNEVPLVPQTTGMSCWAAAAAMLVGWRDRVPVDPGAVAAGAGRWAAYRDGLDPEDVDELATAWGLVVVPSARWTIDRMRSLLSDHGPLWVGEASPGLHSLVVTGIYGDATPARTFVRINDPWPIGDGERYVLSYAELMNNLDAATRAVGAHAQVLHAGGRSRGAQRSRRITTPDAGPKREHTMDHFGRPHGRSRAIALDTIAASERYLHASSLAVDPLARHGGSGENLFVRWNAMPSDVESLDVVVHLHGYSSDAPDRAMLERRVQGSGLELTGRTRPTVAILPRGRKITPAELDAAAAEGRDANPRRYSFPGLLAGDGQGLEDLVAHTLAWLCTEVLGRGGAAPMVDRLVLTAHSGAGAPLNVLLRGHATRRVCNPHEVHLFDALYARAATVARATDGILAWARQRIAAHATAPGALRVIHRGGTAVGSQHVAAQLSVPAAIQASYRVEATRVAHDDIPARFGPMLLSDGAVDLASALSRFRGYGTPVALFQHYRERPPTRMGRARALDGGPAFPTEEEVDQIVAEREDQATAQGLHRISRGLQALAPDWAPDAVSVDHRHLQHEPGVSAPFDFTGDHLAALVQANRFSVPGEGVVLFGLRGCSIVAGGDGAFHASVTLDQDIPDHQTSRCVLGVWNRDANEIAVFSGSTVPAVRYMRNQVGDAGRRANMMLTGTYDYRIGVHRGIYHGIFTEVGTKVVLRSRDDLMYETSDDFDRTSPGDNLHPSFRLGDTGFSSAGCVTVRGSATRWDDGDRHADPNDESAGWSTFRERAGLSSDHSDPADDGRRFTFVLLTGREAYLAARDGTAGLQRLRFGSQGPDVELLQRFLAANTDGAGRPWYGGSIDGDMGPGTTEAWVRYQQARDAGQADGIFAPADGVAAGIDLSAGAGAGAQAWGRPMRGAARSAPQARRRPAPSVWRFGRPLTRALVDGNSPQAEQSAAVRENIARSLRAAEGTRFDQVHSDSGRVNFGIGSWTGSRIADLLDTYAVVAAETGRTATLHGYFGGEAAFTSLRDRFRADGAATAIDAADQRALEALGADASLQDAQIRHLASDIQTDLDAIDRLGTYPFYDGGMGAFSEWAMHVLVHARHQAGGTGLADIITGTIGHFGGEQTMGQGMIDGTITEADVLHEIGERVAQRAYNGTRRRRIAAGDSVTEAERKAERMRTGVRNRYTRLERDHSGSDLSYYVFPQ